MSEDKIAAAIRELASALQDLGNGNSYPRIGAIEGLTMKLCEAFSGIKSGLDAIASAIVDLATTIRDRD